MKQFNGYRAEKSASGRENLPAGGYVAIVMDAAEVPYSWGSVLVISFDIAEGDKSGFFAKDYRANTREDKKWRGTYRLTVPRDDGSEKDEWSKRAFGNAMYALEESNGGFHWDWNEKRLKGLRVGVLFRDKEWEIDGNTGWMTECCTFVPVEDIHTGNFKMPKPKALSPKKEAAPISQVPSSTFEEITDDDDLPF